jgi:hypothetical protein
MVMSKRKQQCEKARAAKRAKREDEGRLMNSLNELHASLEELAASSRNQDLIKLEKKEIKSNFDFVRIACLLSYFEKILEDKLCIQASLEVSECFIHLSKSHSSKLYFAKLIRKWAF